MNPKELEEAQKVIDTPVTEENVEDPIEAVFPASYRSLAEKAHDPVSEFDKNYQW